MSHASKATLDVIHLRLSAYLSRQTINDILILIQIAPEQAGFVNGVTRELILKLRQLIEKAREFNSALYISFVDFRKAFDTVIWAHLWKILADMGVPPNLIVILRRLYEDGTAAVRVDEILSENFKTEVGVGTSGMHHAHCLGGVEKRYTLGRRLINNLRYADDTTLLATIREDMENLLTRLEATSLKFGLAINRDKMKMMIVDRAEQTLRV